MRIQHNIAALNSYRNLSNNNSAVSKNLEKLSSGYRINRAGDDAAGLAISEKMRAQITGLETAQKNAQDGISLVQTAEGALTEVHSMLNRMVELANQSANGTYQNEVDRENLQKEIDSLVSEIDRISQSTNFNGINLLDGTMGGSSTGSGTGELITGKMENELVSELTTGATNATAVYEIDFKGVAFGKDGTANVKFGNFDLNIDVKKDMTATDFAKAVADAINKSALGTDAASAAAREAASNLRFTATADGTKVTIKANGKGVDDVSGLAGGNVKVSISEAEKTDNTPLVSGALTSDKVSVVATGVNGSTAASYKFDLSGLSFNKDGTVTLTVGNFSVDVEVKKGMSSKDFAKAAAEAITKAQWGKDDVTGEFKATAADDGTITITASKKDVDNVSGLADGSGKISVAEKKTEKPEDPIFTGSLTTDIIDTKTDGSNNGEAAKYEIDLSGLTFEKSGTVTVSIGTFSVDVDVTANMTTDDFATAVSNAINANDWQSATAGKYTASVESGKLVLTGTTADGTKDTAFDTNNKVSVKAKEVSSASFKGESRSGGTYGYFELDFSGLTPSDFTDTSSLKLKIGNSTISADGTSSMTTIEDVAKAFEGKTVTQGNVTYTIKAKGSKLILTADKPGPIDINDRLGGAYTLSQIGMNGGSLEGTITDNTVKFVDGTDGSETAIKTGDKYEMDFSKMYQPAEGNKFTINGVTVEFSQTEGEGKVKIGNTLEDTLKNLADYLNKQESFKEEWKVTANGDKLSFEAVADGAKALEIENDVASGWTGVDKITATKVEDKPTDETAKAGDKYEMDFSTLSNPKDGEKLVIGDITVTFKDGQAAVALANGTSINVTIGKDINETIKNLADELNKTTGFKDNWKVTADNGKLTFEALKDGVSIPKVGSGTNWQGADKITAKPLDDNSTPTLPSDGIILQIGDSSADYNRITVTIGDMSAASLGIDGLDISTQEAALASIDKIKNAINIVSATRGDLGAIQNRLEHTINNLSVTTENMTAAESRIRDVDMAKEMMAYTKNNILVQSSQAMLAQANQIPQGVLQLLQ